MAITVTNRIHIHQAVDVVAGYAMSPDTGAGVV